MRDNRVILSFKNRVERELKQLNLLRFLRRNVNTGANGTQDYVIKKGSNTGKVAKL